MGSGKQKAHEAITLAPAPPDPAPDADGQLDTIGSEDTPVADNVEDLVAQLGPDDYDSIVTLAHSMVNEDYDLGDDLPNHIKELKDAEIKALTASYLNNLSPSELQQLAADHGFEHPTLVGLSDSDQHPLVHWLDPAYPDDTASKLKIQAVANDRYQALQAGDTIAGLTLNEVHAAESALGLNAAPAPLAEAWEATPAEVATAMADVTNRAVALQPLHTKNPNGPADAAALIAAENKLQTASCPELGDSLPEMKASAAQLVSQAATKATNSQTAQALTDAGLISPDEAAWLTPAEAIAAARHATGGAQVEELQALAASRAATINQLTGHKAAGIGTAQSFAPIDTSTAEGRQQLLETLNATQEAMALSTQAKAWGAADHAAVGAAAIPNTASDQKNLTTEFRAWAKTQQLGDLRTVAAEAGLTNATSAGTRADIQNYLAGQWDTNIDQAGIQAKLSPPPKPSPTTPNTSTAPTSNSSPATTTLQTAGDGLNSSRPSGPGRFTGKLGTLTAKLKAHQQLAADLPTRTAPAVVANHQWGSGQPWSKGSHESSLHAGPDGSQWMFKPDKSAHGARAHAEAAASDVYHRVGVPGVDVHVTTIGNRTGVVQPLVKGASNLSSSPAGWSQADVDSMVRLHVAAWAVGDHDGHTSNVMRSPSGAVFAVDQGQAFKFFGRDQLTHGWKPAGNYGTPVYHQAYSAATSGGFGAGVHVRAKAALPVIKAFEALPDSQYRAILKPTAAEGVKHGVHWVEPMRQAAQQRHGRTAVTDTEIASEFLDTAVDRKNSLRSSFAQFFTDLGISDAQHLNWVK